MAATQLTLKLKPLKYRNWYPLFLPIQNLNLVLSQEPNVFGPTYEGLITEDGVGIFSQP